MQGSPGSGGAGRGAATVIPVVLAILLLQGPSVIRVGRVTAVYWPDTRIPATVLAEQADGQIRFPGISRPPRFPVRLVVAPNQRTFDSVTAGQIPGWGSGVAFPASNAIVLMVGPNMMQVLTHEMAHLTLRNVETGKRSELPIGAVFPFVGFTPHSDVFDLELAARRYEQGCPKCGRRPCACGGRAPA